MKQPTRRKFITSLATTIVAPAIIGSQIWAAGKAPRAPIAFSTLGCPKWDWKTILRNAAEHGYAALELRGILNQMDLPKCPEFVGDNVKTSINDLRALGLKVSDLGASANLHEPDATKRAAQMDEAKRFIDLAHRMEVPYVRVFPNKLVAG